MRVIFQGKEPTKSLWKCSTIKDGYYRLMKYTVKAECEEGVLLLNTVTGAMVLLDLEETSLLKRLPTYYESWMDALIVDRYLVIDSCDEKTSVFQLRKVIRNLTFRNRDIESFTILPTTACNARCFYCYESTFPRITMTEEIAVEVIKYIVSHCNKRKRLQLNWFGGEPMLGENIIDFICEGLKNDNIEFDSGMISNGYLFTKDNIYKAKHTWHLRSVQITLDGTEEVYNETRISSSKRVSIFSSTL